MSVECDKRHLECVEQRLAYLEQFATGGNVDDDRTWITRLPEYDEYPLFGERSATHVFQFPENSALQDAGVKDRIDQWRRLSYASAHETRHRAIARENEGRRGHPFVLEVDSILSSRVTQELIWDAEYAFMETVLQNPLKHIVGYWSADAMAGRVLATLCSRTMHAVMLSPQTEARKGLEFEHHYGELSQEDSRLCNKLRGSRYDPACLYLLHPSPKNLLVLSTRFPNTRLVAIVESPKKADDEELKKILTARIAARLRAAGPKNERDN